eukprot:TRINITY_DN22763_c0_g1_i2.p1 TRINITY_DN22763_c0_g1~~TRINITY_DN22763_c0_g1_i2.p1  ORF type:complete len:344 (+),score=53.78 TRINITY_DN22763_c0_g1_i2:49-1080(+)
MRACKVGKLLRRAPRAQRRHYAPSYSWKTVTFPTSVRIYEVGPRDGLQNEKGLISADTKIELINRLTDAGLTQIESGSFVSAQKVPQMADTATVFKGIRKKEGVVYPVLTPNIRGHEDAIKNGATTLAVFASATEGFSKKNINCTIEESLQRYKQVCEHALSEGLRVRGYVSCVLGCPYQGYTPPADVVHVAKKLLDMGCYEISLGDTIGVGTPGSTYTLLSEVLKVIPKEQLAVHFHDTYGQALANVLTAIQMGITVVDSSVAGLGGCPYARGATGNVATEDVVYMLKGLNIQVEPDLDKLIDVGNWISKKLERKSNSKVAVAITSKRESEAEIKKKDFVLW